MISVLSSCFFYHKCGLPFYLYRQVVGGVLFFLFKRGVVRSYEDIAGCWMIKASACC